MIVHPKMLLKLFKTLINNKINIVGIMYSNRSNMPKDFCKIKLKNDKYKMRSCNCILVLKWTRRLYSLFTVRNSWNVWTRQKSIQLYFETKMCHWVQGNDWNWLARSNASVFPMIRKCMKEYRKIFFYLFDIA